MYWWCLMQTWDETNNKHKTWTSKAFTTQQISDLSTGPTDCAFFEKLSAFVKTRWPMCEINKCFQREYHKSNSFLHGPRYDFVMSSKSSQRAKCSDRDIWHWQPMKFEKSFQGKGEPYARVADNLGNWETNLNIWKPSLNRSSTSSQADIPIFCYHIFCFVNCRVQPPFVSCVDVKACKNFRLEATGYRKAKFANGLQCSLDFFPVAKFAQIDADKCSTIFMCVFARHHFRRWTKHPSSCCTSNFMPSIIDCILAQKYHPFPICLVPGNHIVQNCLDTRCRFGSLDPTTVRNEVLELEKTFP